MSMNNNKSKLHIELGINFWDTADIYGKGHNEELISNLLISNRDKVFIATKFGFRWREDNTNFFDVSPEYVKTALEKSLQRLKIDTIDLYYAHRIDPNVPVEDMVGAMADLIKERLDTLVYLRPLLLQLEKHMQCIPSLLCKVNIPF